MKILALDIETAPHEAYIWGLFDYTVPVDHLIEAGFTLCWSAKFLDDDTVYSSHYLDSKEHMLTLIHQLLDEADAVITYNGKKFDIPVLNKEFVSLGMSPPAPYKHIDLYQVVRKNFRFASNKLDYICQSLGLGNKIKHRGMDLWKDCIDGDEEAIEEMLKYNQQDVVLLEKLYYVMLPWFKSPINHAIMQGELVCTNCGSKHYHSRGHAYTSAGKYARYQCQDCGTWFRSNKTEAHKDKFIGV